ncbi:MAG: sulfatase [Gemmatimonadota bacterium]|nr:sulfatase [Gemmatimonadota bacterium]
MKRFCVFLAGGILLGGSCGRAPEPPPNVLLISIDTLRADRPGGAGNPRATTPHLDRLAATGTVFSQASSTTSWTLPAHLSLLTGQYPSSHGVVGDIHALPDSKTTLAEFLTRRGYAAAGFVTGPYLDPAFGFAQGFDTYEPCVDYRVERDNQGGIENLVGVHLRSHSGVTSPALHERAVDWLARVPTGKPFFLFLHYWDPHYDFVPEAPYDRVFNPEYRGRLSGRGFSENRAIHSGMAPTERQRVMDLYDGEIRYTDRWIGKVLRALESRGDLERTLIVVVGDHGEEFFEHGGKGHRRNLYGETLDIPLITRLPGVLAGGGVVAEPASLVDVFPTVVAVAGGGRESLAQGRSLQTLAAGTGTRRVYGELHDTHISIREGKWKFIARAGDEGRGELFDLRADPAERADCSGRYPQITADFQAAARAREWARLAPPATPRPSLREGTLAELRALGYVQ